MDAMQKKFIEVLGDKEVSKEIEELEEIEEIDYNAIWNKIDAEK